MNLSIAAILYVLAAASASGTVPTPAGLSVHRWVEGAVYPLAAAPGQLSLVTLEPGEKLVSVAAGDTAQWVIGDTVSGSGATLRAQLLIKPVAAGLRTNMVIATDRRVYQLALESRADAPLASLRWSYAAPALITLKAPPEPACRPSLDLAALNFNYRIKGDVTSWRPLRAFDDGRQTFIEFPATIGQAEAPPLFLRGEDGGLELVNYRVKGRFYVVDRIFAAAELRIGEKKQQKVEIVRTAAKPMPSRRAK